MPQIKKIGVKLLLGILPLIVLSMVIIAFISAEASKGIIEEQIQSNMESELEANVNDINAYLDVVRNTAMNLSRTIGATYRETDMEVYGEILSAVVRDNELVLGSGIWFEPKVYKADEQYMGPYWYKDGGEIVVTYDYSNAEYDYFEQEYYQLAKASNGEAIITDPYYDPTMDVIMASCTAPIYEKNTGAFIGAVTVDIELSAIEQLVEAIKVGKSGNAMLTTADGTYLHCSDQQKVVEAQKITEDENASLAEAAVEMLRQESGTSLYKEGRETYNLYYTSVPGVEWMLMIRMPLSELNEPVNALVQKIGAVCVVVLLCCAAAILLQVGSIAKSLGKVTSFAGALASGDFTIKPLETKTKDELGKMSESLNEMFENNRTVIGDISEDSARIKESSMQLNTATTELIEQFGKIESYMAEVNEAMMSAGAATQEVNASVEEVNSSVGVLASETEKSSKEANRIKGEASEIENNSRKAYENAIAICGEREKELENAYKSAAVVENIGVMADVISNIAEQINLLSLNASIEAARAGEQGRGFTVVASEIGKLAGDTSKAVEEIKNTIESVQEAFANMTKGTGDLLRFLKDTVTPDYDNFVTVGKQYGEAAAAFGDTSERIKDMTESIERIMGEVSSAIQNVAESAQDTANNSARIMEAVNQVSGIVGNVSEMSSGQETIARELGNIVAQFKL